MAGDPELGARIRLRLRQLDHDQRWLAKALGKDPATISRWIDGTRSISTPQLRELSIALHRSVQWLLSRTDDFEDEVPDQEAIHA